MALMNYVSNTDALAILPISVVFSMRNQGQTLMLPLDIPQPERTLGILTKSKRPMTPACEKFNVYIAEQFGDLRTLITDYERSFHWAE